MERTMCKPKADLVPASWSEIDDDVKQWLQMTEAEQDAALKSVYNMSDEELAKLKSEGIEAVNRVFGKAKGK